MKEFDREGLFERLGGDESFVIEVLEIYVNDVPRQLDLIRATLLENDTKGLKNGAHGLKGASSSVGALEMQALSLQIEKEAKAGNLENAASLAEQLEPTFERFKTVLTRQRLV